MLSQDLAGGVSTHQSKEMDGGGGRRPGGSPLIGGDPLHERGEASPQGECEGNPVHSRLRFCAEAGRSCAAGNHFLGEGPVTGDGTENARSRLESGERKQTAL